MNSTYKRPLFIFEMANNHSGNIQHGMKIIRNISEVTKKYDFEFAFKFQYRDLDTLIHNDFKSRTDIKYVKRFKDTALSEQDFITLKNEVKSCGLKTICTPFDEISVDKISKHDYDIIKIASCSFTDWPLLEKIALANKPVIASTAGASLAEIDNVAMFFTNRGIDISLLHCVGEYPTERRNLQLNQIDLLRSRYPYLTIGFSTHEEPNNFDSIKLAVAKGAKIFERHVAINSQEYPINAYSSTPDQIDKWLNSASDALLMCGIKGERQAITEKEKNDLRGLKRGVFARKDIKVGETLTNENIYFAIPCGENQLVANDMSKYDEYTVHSDIVANQAINFSDVSCRNIREKVRDITEKVKDVLNKSGLALPKRFEMELSHHYGIDHFEECGAAILNIINREYCKKLIIVLPNQSHPYHYHVKKEETFHVLYGNLDVELNGKKVSVKEGDLLTIERNDKHAFSSEFGCIFEEISTTHYINDSFYEDVNIANNKKRKTVMPFMFEKIERRL